MCARLDWRWSWGLGAFLLGLGLLGFSGPLQAGPIDNPPRQSPMWTDIVDGKGSWEEKTTTWLSSKPVSVNKLRIGMEAQALERLMGAPGQKVEEGSNVYGDNAVIRVRQGLVVNISVARPLGGRGTNWSLYQGGRPFVTLGDSWDSCRAKLGLPFAIYRHPAKGVRVCLYSQAGADLGIMVLNGQTEGFLLTEPGMLAESLRWSGYSLEEKGE